MSGDERGRARSTSSAGATRANTRYESLQQTSPHATPRDTSVPRMPGNQASLSYPQRPIRGNDSIDLGTEDATGYASEGTAARHRPRNGLTPTVHAHFPVSKDRGRSREREKPPYSSQPATGLATPAVLSRQSTGLSWAGATTTQRDHVYGQLPGASRSDPNFLTFAEGDMPNNRIARSWLAILSASIVVRWFVFIVPILALLWIPGIIGETAAKNATVWGVRLLNWSIWLTIVWLGWWGSVAAAWFAPKFLNGSLGVVAPELKHYILYLQNVRRWSALWAWSLVNWIAFNPIIAADGPGDSSQGNGHTLHQMIQGLFGIFCAICVLLVEKIFIQMIARNFHKKSYADRIKIQKGQINFLIQLYLYSHDIGRSDTLDNAFRQKDPAKVIKRALKGVRNVAQTGATALGTVASEMAGERVLQPNSPASMVTTALQSANKSRQLARRIFFSYCPSGAHALLLNDVAHCFATREEALEAFSTLDQDGNGDVTMEELEMCLLEIHRERLALASSMRDVDSAVARLDGILLFIWYFAAVLIVISLLDVGFSTLVAGAGTFILGLSWLIGTTAQEVLLSCIFLFVKHPYDVSDRVDINNVSYVVTEMHLLYTVFRQTDGKIVQIPHALLNTYVLVNIRRSGAISEHFSWDVDIGTTFEQIERLRADMLHFLEQESRDFRPLMDIAVMDFAGQSKLTLGADICYKSNWQNGTLKAQRRNKWIIALKENLFKNQIWGPGNAANPHPPPADPTVVKLLREEAAPAYEANRGASSPRSEPNRSPASSNDNATVSPAQLARGLSSRQAVIQDASAVIWSARRPLDAGGDLYGDDEETAASSEPIPLSSVATEMPPMPMLRSTTPLGHHGDRHAVRGESEALEMRQRS